MRTIEELQESNRVFVTPQDVGPLLGMHPQTINLMAKDGTLPFTFIRSGNRTKIPRLALLNWLGAKGGQQDDTAVC